ncbi:MAG: hypothetical protein HC938_04755 [Nitrospira sp.]|nr:hypothetical protein [Nitrospira sp.]
MYAARNRDAGIWRYDLWDVSAPPVMVAAQTSMGRDGGEHDFGADTAIRNTALEAGGPVSDLAHEKRWEHPRSP